MIGLHMQVYWESLVSASNVKLTSNVLKAKSYDSMKDYWHLCIKIIDVIDREYCK